MDFKYEYSLGPGENNKYTLDSLEPVNAIYSPADSDIDKGNPFIEALPHRLSESQYANHYYRKLPFVPSKEGPKRLLENEILSLRDIRIPLSFGFEMETRFLSSLIISYRARMPFLIPRGYPVMKENRSGMQPFLSKTVTGGDSGIGFTLLGVGGSGKSEAVRMMLSRYPQVIKHHCDGVGVFTQITWIYINAPVNSNLSDLYNSFARAVDEALGNIFPVYERLMKLEKSVGAKADYVALLVRVFNIGAILMDEIQRLGAGTKGNVTSSYDSLMNIINTTKVAFIAIGTDKAYLSLYVNQYLMRRSGPGINASKYCTDKKQFEIIMRFLLKDYNSWFRVPQKLTPDVLEAMYEATYGVIDNIISVMIFIYQMYIVQNKEEEFFTPELIRMAANSRNPFLANATNIELKSNPVVREVYSAEEETMPEEVPLMAASSAERENNYIQKLLTTSAKPSVAMEVFKRTKNNCIENDSGYNDITIMKAVERVLAKKGNENLNETALVQKTLELLKKKKTDKRPSASKSVADEARSIVMGFAGYPAASG